MSTTIVSPFVAHPATVYEIQANQDAAVDMGLDCPRCGASARLDAAHHQATRTEPCRFLGVQLYCACAGDFMSRLGIVGFVPADEVL